MLKRAISGAIFLVIFISCLLWDSYSMIGFFFVVTVLASNELFRLIQRPDMKAHEVIGGILSKALYLFPSAYLAGIIDVKWVSLTLLPFLAVPIAELFSKNKYALVNMVLTYFPAFYISIPFVLLVDIAFIEGIFNPYPILGFFILIWIYDTGAYLSGRFFGKHKLFERISPKKTWEGLIGGAILSFSVAIFIMPKFIPELNAWKWGVVSLIVVLFGTLGDLIESMMKRNAGVKDSGSIMPGHGGMLDRFDSVLFAAPFYWLFLQLI